MRASYSRAFTARTLVEILQTFDSVADKIRFHAEGPGHSYRRKNIFDLPNPSPVID
jgi:hypothetical protein